MSEKTDIAGGVSVLVDVPGQGIVRMPYRESLHWAKLGRVIREDAPEPAPMAAAEPLPEPVTVSEPILHPVTAPPSPIDHPVTADPSPDPSPSPAPSPDPSPVPTPARPAFTADSLLTADGADITADFE